MNVCLGGGCYCVCEKGPLSPGLTSCSSKNLQYKIENQNKWFFDEYFNIKLEHFSWFIWKILIYRLLIS